MCFQTPLIRYIREWSCYASRMDPLRERESETRRSGVQQQPTAVQQERRPHGINSTHRSHPPPWETMDRSSSPSLNVKSHRTRRRRDISISRLWLAPLLRRCKRPAKVQATLQLKQVPLPSEACSNPSI